MADEAEWSAPTISIDVPSWTEKLDKADTAEELHVYTYMLTHLYGTPTS